MSDSLPGYGSGHADIIHAFSIGFRSLAVPWEGSAFQRTFRESILLSELSILLTSVSSQPIWCDRRSCLNDADVAEVAIKKLEFRR